MDLGALLPIVLLIVGGAVAGGAIVAVVLLRRAPAETPIPDPGDWWTCRRCGRSNVVGSPRCHACGEWQA